MDPQIPQLVEQFLKHIKLPAAKPPKSFMLGVVGQIGAGKTTVARMLNENLPGSIVVSANSARFLLKETNMPWGDNVRAIMRGVVENLLQRGYGVILDGATAEERDRASLAQALATVSGAAAAYAYVYADTNTCIAREQAKYEDTTWQSSFDDFRVNTLDKMLDNIRSREALHKELRSSIASVPGFVGEIDNTGTLTQLAEQVATIEAAVKKQLGI